MSFRESAAPCAPSDKNPFSASQGFHGLQCHDYIFNNSSTSQRAYYRWNQLSRFRISYDDYAAIPLFMERNYHGDQSTICHQPSLSNGFIQHSKSLTSAPISFVKKKRRFALSSRGPPGFE